MSENIRVSSDEILAVMIILDDLTKNSVFQKGVFLYEGPALIPAHVYDLIVSANQNFQTVLRQRKQMQ